MAYPKITIVTANRNYGKLLEKTILSVLSQGYPNLEYIIIDGASDDNSVEIIKKYEKSLFYWETSQDNGPYEAINKGFARSTGEIMAWLNAGDTYFPRTLEEVAGIFSRFPEVKWITGLPSKIQGGVVYDVKGLVPRPKEFIQAGLYLEGDFGPIQQESSFWRRSLWEKAGPLKRDIKFAADFELWTRFAKISELVSVGALLSGFSIYGDMNRSIAHFDEYKKEVSKVIDGFPGEIKTLRKKIMRDIGIYKRIKKYAGIRNVVGAALNLSKYKGAVLEKNLAGGECRISHKEYLA